VPITYTVREYLALPAWKKLVYRIYRHPLVLFGVAPTILFIFAQRIALPTAGKREQWSVHFTNLSLLAAFMVLGYFIGFGTVLAIQLPIILIGATIGVWLFYIQHQFEHLLGTRGRMNSRRPRCTAARITSCPNCCRITGNIGLHHIHHLSVRIPQLRAASLPRRKSEFQQVSTIELLGSLKCVSLRLWDEDQKLVGFAHLKTLGLESNSLA
jgi:omega-6 fatty acid desaturase (delta-12 desaturase)